MKNFLQIISKIMNLNEKVIERLKINTEQQLKTIKSFLESISLETEPD